MHLGKCEQMLKNLTKELQKNIFFVISIIIEKPQNM